MINDIKYEPAKVGLVGDEIAVMSVYGFTLPLRRRTRGDEAIAERLILSLTPMSGLLSRGFRRFLIELFSVSSPLLTMKCPLEFAV